MRHKFLARTAARLGIPSVALAHHADDQVELFFVRLLRGTGNEGLAGMKWSSPSPANPKITLVRPLLDQSKADLETFAKARALVFAEDATNASLEIQRNRIRQELLPMLRERYQPGLTRTILRYMELAQAESYFVSEAAERWLAQRRKRPFTRLPEAVQRRLVQLQLFKLKQPLDFELVEQLRLHPNRAVSTGPGAGLIRASDGRVSLRPAGREVFRMGSLRVDLRRRRTVQFGAVKLSWKIADEAGMKQTRSPQCGAVRRGQGRVRGLPAPLAAGGSFSADRRGPCCQIAGYFHQPESAAGGTPPESGGGDGARARFLGGGFAHGGRV